MISEPRNPLTTHNFIEKEFFKHDQVGVDDFVLLEDYENEESFVNNLRIRFQKNVIYTYIGQVLISVNPYKQLPLYSQNDVNAYHKKHFFEVPPHIFAIAENVLQSLITENKSQCVLISGESGSGKTEASKYVLQYIAAASGHQVIVETVTEKLLNSNPILETFGNAKTNRNDNSSRFGKYMDIRFDFAGAPIGGNICNYLLEKSRVIKQSKEERNFHIFYQLLAGSNDDQLKRMDLKRSWSRYHYLTNKEEFSNTNKNYRLDFETLQHALTILGFSTNEQNQIFNIVASVLHIGNINFSDESGQVKILEEKNVKIIAELIGCNSNDLSQALIFRTIEVQNDIVKSPLNFEMAIFARDALAKAIYERLFSWLVNRINLSLRTKFCDISETNALGILDIYGFEVFKTNSFEQFCINFCNEKLQQLFIELTLKSEQEEYQREGIKWIPINYFDNKVICSLIEEKYEGIIAVLDEECLRPGICNDLTFLEKLTNKFINHPHFICHSSTPTHIQKIMDRKEFQIVHYAGTVNYNVEGFLEKNNDLLFRDLKETMNKASNFVICACFLDEEYKNKKRPETAVAHFKNSLNNLIDTLMCKQPSYIRCIKPNQLQLQGIFDDDLILHQVKYLGLMENLRVRRAGFAYRRTYDMFLQRYKCLSKSTWPNFNGTAKQGVELLIKDLNYNSEDYRMGKSKIFIRFPKTIFYTEDVFQEKKHAIAAIIQSHWKGRKQRKIYIKQRKTIIILQSYCRRFIALQKIKRKYSAAIIIRSFIKGFITRNEPSNGFNNKFLVKSKKMWLIKLSTQLPLNLLDNRWPVAPKHCFEISEYLHKLYRLHLAKCYFQQLSLGKKRQLQLKVIAEKTFKGRKSNYNESVHLWFIENRTSEDNTRNIEDFTVKNFHAENLIYASPCIKFDRHGYKPRERFILLSDKAIYLLDSKTYQQKHKLLLETIALTLTNRSDNFLLIQIPLDTKKEKGDLILEIPYIIEFCTFIIDTFKNSNLLQIADKTLIKHNMLKGKFGVIDLEMGEKSGIYKNKKGHLAVVAGK